MKTLLLNFSSSSKKESTLICHEVGNVIKGLIRDVLVLFGITLFEAFALKLCKFYGISKIRHIAWMFTPPSPPCDCDILSNDSSVGAELLKNSWRPLY